MHKKQIPKNLQQKHKTALKRSTFMNLRPKVRIAAEINTET